MSAEFPISLTIGATVVTPLEIQRSFQATPEETIAIYATAIPHYANIIKEMDSRRLFPEDDGESELQGIARAHVPVTSSLEQTVKERKIMVRGLALKRKYKNIQSRNERAKHSYAAWINEQVRDGLLTEDEVQRHPLYQRFLLAPEAPPSIEDSLSENGSRIRDYLLSHEAATRQEVAKNLGITLGTVTNHEPALGEWAEKNGYRFTAIKPEGRRIPPKDRVVRYRLDVKKK